MQRILNGIDTLPAVVRELGCRKLFLVIDSSYPFLSIKDAVEALDVLSLKFDGFTPNPLFEQVCVGVDMFLSANCDSIMAIGGGSAIDVAKCIKLAVIAKTAKDTLIPPLVSQKAILKEDVRIPFIAIPTTAGTGAESTHNAVMYYEGAKQTITDDAILPDVALIEPAVLKTLPLYQKKCTMMDALCQGIESWWSIHSTEESRFYSKKTVELIMAHWQKYIFESDSDATIQIMLAANYGGRAINIAQTTAAHAMSYKITSMYNLPHGHAVSVCLPAIWDYMLSHQELCIDYRGVNYVNDVFASISVIMGGSNPEDAVEIFNEMMHMLEMRYPNAKRNHKEEVEILVKSVNPVRLKNNPIRIDSYAAKLIYDRILGI